VFGADAQAPRLVVTEPTEAALTPLTAGLGDRLRQRARRVPRYTGIGYEDVPCVCGSDREADAEQQP